MLQSSVPTTDFQRTWRAHKKCSASSLTPDIKVGIVGSLTTEPLEAYIGTQLLNKNYKNPKILFGAFGQIHQACLEPEKFFNSTPDSIIILWRLEDIFENLEMVTKEQIFEGMDNIISSLKKLRNHFNGTIIVSTPSFPSTPAFDLLKLDGLSVQNNIFYEAIAIWHTALQTIDRIHSLDLNALIMKIGFLNAFDQRKYALYRQPWSEELWCLIGKQCGRLICQQTLSTKKCIVLDADNTLWGGIIGEDGISGIELSNEFPGSEYKKFQEQLLYLHNRGIMLAVASKNNEADFFEVLDNHSAMILKKKHFLTFQIHWKSKVESITEIAKELNIGTNSIIFIDDNPKEIAEVQSRLPEVTCLTVPEEISDLPYIFSGTDYFDQENLTSEDLLRNEMMHAETSRKESQSTMTEAEFKESLELEMDVFIAHEQHIARITQLINKTNQFNLTTHRRTQDEVAQLIQSKNHTVIGMIMRDKYGDYGLVGVAILEYIKKNCTIDTLLMSCRVLGRDAEKAFIAALSTFAKEHHCTDLNGEYIQTAKNTLVKNLFKENGFTKSKNENKWSIKIKDIPISPAHIKLKIRTNTYKKTNEEI